MAEENLQEIGTLWEELLPDPSARAYANENLRMLVLSVGKLDDGSEYYAYLALSPANYIEMQKAEQSGDSFVLSDFGEVLQWGKGKEPPEAVKQKMTTEYGANPNFCEDVQSAIQKALEASSTE